MAKNETGEKFRQEFLLNLTNKEFKTNWFESYLILLTPNEQIQILISLKEIFEKEETEVEDFHCLARYYGVKSDTEATLFSLIGITFPDFVDRLAFWSDFMRNKGEYQELDK